jgi:hypothetical protein
VARDQRTRLNNMIAERAPAAAIQQPGKATLTDEETEDEATQDEPAPAATETPRRRSVFDAPLQRDLDAPPATDDEPPASGDE